MRKVIPIFIIAILLFPCFVFAESDNEVIKEYIFTTNDMNYEYEPEEKITIGSDEYRLKGIIRYELLSKKEYISRDHIFTDLTEQSIPKTKTFDNMGENVKLHLKKDSVSYTENKGYAVEQYNNSNIPKTKNITVDGKSYIGKLTRTETKENEKPFHINGRFEGKPESKFYFNGRYLSLGTGDTPTWQGYEKELISYFNLPRGSKITDSRYTSGYINENGKPVRYAVFSGSYPSNSYTAYYEYHTFNAVGTYDNDVKKNEYEVKAYVNYEKVVEEEKDFPITKAIAIGASILLFALLVAVILYIISKKRKEKKYQYE